MAVLAGIRVYPVKALDPLILDAVRLGPGGALEPDRRWRFVDEAGLPVNGKRHARIHAWRAAFESDAGALVLRDGADPPRRFDLLRDRAALEAWASERLGFPVLLQRDDATGFPDDPDNAGPTLVSTASLEAVRRWFPGLDLENVRRRFRANLEIDGLPPFGEDRLFGVKGESVRFRIGGVEFEGRNPCRRCVVPSRDPDGGEAWPGFQKTFAERRREELPPWAELSRFDTTYRFAVNTRVPAGQEGRVLRVGDPLTL
jgi:uncharacterized protein YcbX